MVERNDSRQAQAAVQPAFIARPRGLPTVHDAYQLQTAVRQALRYQGSGHSRPSGASRVGPSCKIRVR